MLKRILLCLISLCLIGCVNHTEEEIPAYIEETFIGINDYIPYFTEEEKKSTSSFESYSELDSLGRCGVAFANLGKELLPTEERDSISKIIPSGWHSYNFEEIGYLYNRCHLIAYCLTGENANELNLITGTRTMNQTMAMFENPVKAYVEETGHHVLYRVTPYFEEDNLLCTGVFMEAWSVEDEGKDICFNVFVYNVQPKIEIDYKTGEAKELYSNILFKPEIQEEVLFYNKKNIGTRGYMKLSEEKFNQVSDQELYEFCETLNPDYNYFTIDFGNGRGAVFPASTYFPIEVGEINKQGEMIHVEEYVYVSKEGIESIAVESKSIEQVVYVSVKGKIHFKSNCSGMKQYTTMDYKEAVECGYSICTKCKGE